MIYMGYELPATIKDIDIPSFGSGEPAALPPSPVTRGGGPFYLGARMSLPYFREWVENWRSSPRVSEMDLEQRGAFHEMLCLSWQMGPVPNDPERLAILIGVKPADFIRAWRKPLVRCWRKTRKGLVNDRLERERTWSESRQKKARESAKHRVYSTSNDAGAVRAQSARNANGSAQIALLSRSRTRTRSRSKDKKEEKSKRGAPAAPTHAVHWNPQKKIFEGEGLDSLKAKLADRYDSELDRKWVAAVWESIQTWAEDHPDLAEEKNRLEAQANAKGWGLAILTWYNRDATKERQYRR